MIAYFVLLAAVAALRGAELLLSQRNRAAMASEHGAKPARDPIFPLMVFVHVMPFWAIPAEIFFFHRSFIPWLGVPMLVLFAAAEGLRLWVFLSLGTYWNARVMVPPDLEPVTSGPYRYIRHPNYLVVIVELFSLPLIYSCYWSALALTTINGIVLYFRIRDEERALFETEAYRRAMADKPRFVPRIRRN